MRKKLKIFAAICCFCLAALPLLAGEGIGKRLSEKAENTSTKKMLSEELLAYHYYPVESSWFSSSHPGAFYNAVLIDDTFSLFEGSLHLNDGSIWAVWYEDVYKMSYWLATDWIVISRNHSLFSSYDFKLTNQNTGESVLANLHMGPLYDSFYRRWIIAIDDYSNLVYLDDGSVWNMSLFDASTIYEWSVGHTVIIGVSDSFFNPNFLLNVDLMTSASGKAY